MDLCFLQGLLYISGMHVYVWESYTYMGCMFLSGHAVHIWDACVCLGMLYISGMHVSVWACCTYMDVCFLQGLLYIHNSPLHVHGRLQSSNVLVDSRWQCKVADFGLRQFRSDSSIRKYHPATESKSRSCLYFHSSIYPCIGMWCDAFIMYRRLRQFRSNSFWKYHPSTESKQWSCLSIHIALVSRIWMWPYM
jgi:hypothetical protein